MIRNSADDIADYVADEVDSASEAYDAIVDDGPFEPFSIIPEDKRAEVVATVRQTSVDNGQALVDSQKQAVLKVHSKPPGIGDISLVQASDCDMFVLWDNPDRQLGFTLSLDGRNRINWVIRQWIKPEAIAVHRVIINSVPAEMTKIKADRLPIPDWCVIQLRQLQAIRFPGPLSDSRDCILCIACMQHSLSRPVKLHEERYICSSCVSVWHLACAKSAAREIDVDPEFMCPFCI